MNAGGTRLRLEARQTWLELGPDAVVVLPLGPRNIASDCLRHDPPTALEVEQAIDVIEEALLRAGLPQAPRGTIVTSSTLLRALPGLERDGAVLARDAVEALFQRLASAALGHPSALAGMPMGADVAAALLILREIMHHLGYDAVRVVGG